MFGVYLMDIKIAIAVSIIVIIVIAGVIVSSFGAFVRSTTPTTPSEETKVAIHSFSSLEEFKKFISSARESMYPWGMPVYSEVRAISLPAAPAVTEGKALYSRTNIQVEGVDEADIVKTDGEYIYVASQNKVYIVKAYPPEEAKVISVLVFNSSIRGLFIAEDRLVVITSTPMVRIMTPEVEVRTLVKPVKVPISNTTLYLYDVSDIEEPKLLNKVVISGNYITARLIDRYTYVIISMPLWRINDSVILPRLNGVEVPITDIKYFEKDVGYSFTIIVAMDIDTGEFNREIFLLGSSSRIYVSLKNLYILSRRWINEYELMEKTLKAIKSLMPEDVKARIDEIMVMEIPNYKKYREVNEVLVTWFNSLSDEEKEEVMKVVVKSLENTWREETMIYRFSLNGLNVIARAKGTVPGYVLDQFSMDEYSDYFRVATTRTSFVAEGTKIRPTPMNGIYILNMDLEIVGKLEDLAPGERIYAARYMGNIMYLVTFRRVDPLFGIDLSDPKNPKVLGYLKIPGYSEYLHPYKEKYLIGIGMDVDEETNRVKGMKISLFDISNITDIKEISTITIGGPGTWSPILHDHKAFMINNEKGYFAIPIYTEKGSSAAYIIDIIEGKLSIRGFINHNGVERVIYIDNYLYTISKASIKIVSEDLTPITEIKLS